MSTFTKIRKELKQLTAGLRIRPTFFIIGAQKCGTTSFYHYLGEHPQIKTSLHKEIHYYDLHFSQGPRWYRSMFPLVTRNVMTFEASPSYIFYPQTPARLAADFPDAKLIMLMRDPVERAYSHYMHNTRKSYETLTFAEALDQEDARIQPERAKMLQDEMYQSEDYRQFSYRTRGIYIEQIQHWLKFFPREQFLFLFSEDLFANPQQVYERAQRFLGVEIVPLSDFRAYNVGKTSDIDASIQQSLQAFYAPYNQALFDMLDQTCEQWLV